LSKLVCNTTLSPSETVTNSVNDRMVFNSAKHGFDRAQYGRYENGQDLRYTTVIRLVNCFDMSNKGFFSNGI